MAEWFGILNFDEPVVSHDKLGAADHSSVDQDALFEPILSNFGTESCWLYTQGRFQNFRQGGVKKYFALRAKKFFLPPHIDFLRVSCRKKGFFCCCMQIKSTFCSCVLKKKYILPTAVE